MISKLLDGLASGNICGHEDYFNETDDAYASTKRIRTISYQLIAPIILSIGIVGNMINLLILTKRPFVKGGTSIYLTALSCTDLSVMITVIPMVIRWNHAQAKTLGVAIYHAYIELFVNNLFIAASVFIVLCLTVERFFSICHPVKLRGVATDLIAKKAIFCCYLLALLISIPLICLKKVCLITDNNNQNCHHWDFHENKQITFSIYWNIYLVVTELLMRFGPTLIVAVLNIFIIRRFRQITLKRKSFSAAMINKQHPLNPVINIRRALRNKKYQEEKRLVVLLRAIVIFFTITMTPSAVLSLLYRESQEMAFEFQLFRAAANNLELSNFALNFCVYFLCSKEFRIGLKDLINSCVTCDDNSENDTIAKDTIANIDCGQNNINMFNFSETSDINSVG